MTKFNTNQFGRKYNSLFYFFEHIFFKFLILKISNYNQPKMSQKLEIIKFKYRFNKFLLVIKHVSMQK